MDLLTVFVVDDELIVREYYSTRFPWADIGMRLVGEAADGHAALEQCKQLRPDLALVDITMPGMNGLELLEALRADVPQTRCVILTSHQDFAYVQSALRLGALDYVIKAATTPDEMLVLFQRIRAQIEQQKRQSKASSLRRRWLARLLIEGWSNTPGLGVELQRLGLPLRAEQMRVLLVRQELTSRTDERESSGEEHQTLLIEQEIDSVTENLVATAWTTLAPNVYAVIHTFPDGTPHESSEQTLRGVFEQLRARLGSDYLLSGGLSEVHSSLARASIARQEAERALASEFYYSTNELLVTPPPWQPISHELHQRLAANLTAPQPGRGAVLPHVEQVISAVILACREAWIDPQQTRLLVVNAVRQLAQALGGTVSPLESTLWPLQIAQTRTSADALRWAVQAVSTSVLAHGQMQLRPEIQRVLSHVQENLSLPYDLAGAAKMAGLHPNYFSALFHQQTGQTFMEYLSRLRVERAAAYLREGGWSTQQIAEMVGIPNYRTFFNVFRRVMGTSPSEFVSRFQQ